MQIAEPKSEWRVYQSRHDAVRIEVADHEEPERVVIHSQSGHHWSIPRAQLEQWWQPV
jgi:hypothetical protein